MAFCFCSQPPLRKTGFLQGRSKREEQPRSLIIFNKENLFGHPHNFSGKVNFNATPCGAVMDSDLSGENCTSSGKSVSILFVVQSDTDQNNILYFKTGGVKSSNFPAIISLNRLLPPRVPNNPRVSFGDPLNAPDVGPLFFPSGTCSVGDPTRL